MWSTDNPIANKAPLLPIAVCLISGIAIGSYTTSWFPSSLPVLYGLIGLVGISFLLTNKPVLHTISLYTCSMVLGILLSNIEQTKINKLIDGKERIYEGIVISEPSEKAKTMAVQLLFCNNRRNITCYIRKDNRSRLLKPGDGLQFTTRIEHGWHNSTTCFIESDNWEGKKVSMMKISIIDRARITFLKWRHHLLLKYKLNGAENDVYAVLAAMTLGDKSALNKELRDTYSITGASHVLALSGLHLSIIYLLLTTLMFQRRRQHLWTQVLIVLSIWAFALLVGLPVSVVRSALMISIFALFSLGNRPHMSVNLLCLAAIIILVISPHALHDIGFQLSFITVFSILLFMPLFAPKESNPIKNCLWVSLAAQIGSAPLVAFYFGRFSTYFLLTNLIVLPLAYIILCGTLVMLLVPQVSIVLIWVVELLNSLLSIIAKLPMASLEGLHPSVVQVLLCYLCGASLYGAILVWKNKWIPQR